MRYTSTILAIAASLAFVNAQDLSKIPTCAIPCFVAALPLSGCQATDTKCQCTTGRKAIQDSVTSCTPSKCSADDQTKAASAVQVLCAQAGVTITDVPAAATSAAASAASSAAASGSAAASAAVSSVKASASAAASSAASAAASAASSKAAAATSTGAASAGNVVGYGAVAMGLAAALL